MNADALCDDWSCPAAASCARHFGRSAAYAATTMPAPATKTYTRTPDAESCPAYRFDRPKPWLIRQPWQTTHAGAG